MYIEVKSRSNKSILVIVNAITSIIDEIVNDGSGGSPVTKGKITLINGENIYTNETLVALKAKLDALL